MIKCSTHTLHAHGAKCCTAAVHLHPSTLYFKQWRPRHCWSHRSRARSSSDKDVCTAVDEISVEIPTVDARSCIRLKVVPTGPAQQAILVEAVAPGSSAADAGVQPGMKLTAISDPVRRNEVWQLQDRPSIRYIRDVLRMRSSPLIELRFTGPSAELLTAMEAAEDMLLLASEGPRNASRPATTSGGSSSGEAETDSTTATSSSLVSLTSLSSSEEGASTMAERMQQQYEQKQKDSQGVIAFKQRQQRRKEYLNTVGQRNDSSFGVLLAAAFLLPAAVILAVAYSTGYLDSLYNNTMR